jgi:hypothetical protein
LPARRHHHQERNAAHHLRQQHKHNAQHKRQDQVGQTPALAGQLKQAIAGIQ